MEIVTGIYFFCSDIQSVDVLRQVQNDGINDF